MRALVQHEYGSTEVLRVAEVPTPQPADDQVLVAVRAASINEWDHGLMTGTPLVNRMGGLRRPQQRILGSDVAGVVAAVGPAVSGVAVGDEVMGDLSGCGFGAFADYALATPSALTAKPASLSWQQAAAIPQAGVLALAGLRKGWPVEGKRVLVNGAGGGVGTFAVQVARALGAEVTAVDGAGKLEALRRLGAHHVIDYAQQDFVTTGPYDLILDVIATRSVRDYTRALRARGVAAIEGGQTRRLLAVAALGQLLAGGRQVQLVMLRPNDPEQLELLVQLMQVGAVHPVLDRDFGLDDAVAAMEHYETGSHLGKITISM